MPSHLRIALIGLLGMWLTIFSAQAQTVTAGPDSTQVNTQKSVTDSSRRTEKFLGWRVTRPKKAALLSAVLPGAGQIYNRRYWKLPLVYGAIGAAVGTEVFYQMRYKEYSLGYKNRTDGVAATVDTGPRSSREASAANVRVGLEFYRRNRDKWIAFTAVAYTLNIVDALVDAHLRDFDISDDLSMQWQPDVLRVPTARLTPGVAISLTLKSHK
ncbi:hypothetical protein FY528_19800 [Hymenobacter lutimineralis]|uniref:DUF5683 domain-containing protein n=1 Tax=Hymenobacter lutimineralis TaxID=2606448 RepID=A0A5D6UUJ6_9BACT|nr:DUF5683 domain-containing protein [Hymenobacter lutimineralis]TYZ06009.1 hypothetical protein FY528_19800 [Hymenobacter lutimineralis]